MKKILALLACLAFATPAYATTMVDGLSEVADWHVCHLEADADAVWQVVKQDVNASYPVWTEKVQSGACRLVQQRPATVVKVLEQFEVTDGDKILVMTKLELNMSGVTLYAIRGDHRTNTGA